MWLSQDDNRVRSSYMYINNLYGMVLFDNREITDMCRSNKYDFYTGQKGRNAIMFIDTSKEVEKHLTAINYLGI